MRIGAGEEFDAAAAADASDTVAANNRAVCRMYDGSLTSAIQACFLLFCQSYRQLATDLLTAPRDFQETNADSDEPEALSCKRLHCQWEQDSRPTAKATRVVLCGVPSIGISNLVRKESCLSKSCPMK